MKIGFWTLGLTGSVQEILELATGLGYEGVALRCTRPPEEKHEGDGRIVIADGQVTVDSTLAEIDAVRDAFAAANIEIPTLICYSHWGRRDMGHLEDVYDPEWLEADIAKQASIAERLGAKRIRLMVGQPTPGQSYEEFLPPLFDCIERGLQHTPSVGAVFENHNGTALAEDLLKAVRSSGSERLGVMFSPDHCFTTQEHIIDLIDEYSPYIAEVCWADRRVVQKDLARFDGRYYYVQYEVCMPGEGDLPNAAMFRSLADHGFDGYVYLKWEKTPSFNHHLPPLQEALPVFVDFMRQFDVIESLTSA